MFWTIISSIADIIQIGAFIFSGASFVYTKSELLLSYWFVTIPIVIASLVSILKISKNIYDDVVISSESIRFTSTARDLGTNKFISDFDLIVPKSVVFEILERKVFKIASLLSGDVRFCGAELTIWFKDTEISSTLNLRYFSNHKSLKISFDILNYKPPTRKSINQNQLQIESNPNIYPSFYDQKHWREAVIWILETRQKDLLGKKHAISIAIVNDVVWIQIVVFEPISQSYVYQLKESNLSYGIGKDQILAHSFS